MNKKCAIYPEKLNPLVTTQGNTKIGLIAIERGLATLLGLYNFRTTKVDVFDNDAQQYDTFNIIDEEQMA